MSENRNKPYKTKAWEITRRKVLKYDKGLCQKCLGNYMSDATMPRKRTKAVLVHHHFHVTEYPQFKYQMFVKLPDGTTVRNLYSLCSACHEEVHADTHRNRFRRKQRVLKMILSLLKNDGIKKGE